MADHGDVVRRSFERQVGLFSGPASPFAARPASSLAWIEPLHRKHVVLDVACGAAHASEPVAPRVRQVVGIDLTRALLDLAAQRLREQRIGNVLLQEGDAHSLPFVDAAFDIVCCRSSMHHFDDPRLALREMERVCRPGGRVVIVDLVAPAAEVRDTYDDLHRLVDPSHMHSFTERELAEAMPGGIDGLIYASTATIRLPIEIAFTEQSADAEVLARLEGEIDGRGAPTGFEPARDDDDGKVVVSFVTCVMHTQKPG